MTDSDRRAHNAVCLLELFPTFRSRILGIIDFLEQQGLRPRIKEAWRSREDQLRLFKAGDTRAKFDLHNVTQSLYDCMVNESRAKRIPNTALRASTKSSCLEAARRYLGELFHAPPRLSCDEQSSPSGAC